MEKLTAQDCERIYGEIQDIMPCRYMGKKRTPYCHAFFGDAGKELTCVKLPEKEVRDLIEAKLLRQRHTVLVDCCGLA